MKKDESREAFVFLELQISVLLCVGGNGCRGGRDADEASSLAFVTKFDETVDFRKKRVITTDSDVHAWVEAGTTLTNENRSAGDELSREALDAEHFRLRVAAVSRRTLSFFVSHENSFSASGAQVLDRDRVDADLHEVLTMTLLPLVHLPSLLLVNNDFLATLFPDDGTRNRRA